MTKLPWISLAILFVAYTTFSRFLSRFQMTWLGWGIVLALTLFQALLLTTLFERLRILAGRWLRSDVGYFTLIILISLGVTIALVWFRTFGYFLVIITAEILVRLDLQDAEFNRFQALIILTFFSLSGLAAGWASSHLMTQDHLK